MSTVEQRHQTPRRPTGSRMENRAAVVLAVLGVVVAAATFVVPNPDAADLCWAGGFALLLAAVVMVVVGQVHARGDRLAVLPTSTSGWVALAGFLAAAALLFTPLAEVSLALGLVAGAFGVGAVVVQRERSLPVIVLPLLGGTFVLAFLLGELLIGHR